MVDVDALEEELEEQSDLLQSLILRSKQQRKDIKEMKRELTKLSVDLDEEETISSEQPLP